jgi:5-methylcytosine-specific restriction endonuclease McrA
VLTLGGRCGPHETQAKRKENRRRNSHPRRRIYDDPRWPETSMAVRIRDHFTCQRCGYHGFRVLAAHKTPVLELLQLGRDPFDPEECECLCLVCSGREDGARGSQ